MRYLKELRQQIEGVARKKPWLNVDKVMKEVDKKIETGEIPTQKYIDSPIEQQLSLGGQKFWRSICKMAINFYMDNRGERKYIRHLIPFIKQGIMRKYHLYWYYPECNIFPDLIEQNQVIHALTLHGNPRKKILYSVIHLYSAFQFIVLLNDNYQGDEINQSYLFDVITSKNISDDYSINNTLKNAEVQKTLNELLAPESRYLEKVNKLFGFIFEKQRFDRLEKLQKQTIEEILSRYSEDEIMREEDYRKLCSKLASNIIQTLIIQRQRRLNQC
ncbi:MAG: hypothetical protein AB4062_11430 [Crocosphaera sp.]